MKKEFVTLGEQTNSRSASGDRERIHSSTSMAPIAEPGVTPMQNAIAGAGTNLRDYNSVANQQLQLATMAKSQAAQNPSLNPSSTSNAKDSRGNTKPVTGSQVQPTSGSGSLSAAEASGKANNNANAALRKSVQAKAQAAQSNVNRETNQTTPTSSPVSGDTNNVGGLRAAERSARAQTNRNARMRSNANAQQANIDQSNTNQRNAAMNNKAANQETADRNNVRANASRTAANNSAANQEMANRNTVRNQASRTASNNQAANQEMSVRNQIRQSAKKQGDIQRAQAQRSNVQSQYGAGGRDQAQANLSRLRVRQINKGASPVSQAEVDAPNAGAMEVNDSAAAMSDGYSLRSTGTTSRGENASQYNARLETDRRAALPAAERIKLQADEAAIARAEKERQYIRLQDQAFMARQDVLSGGYASQQVAAGNQDIVGREVFKTQSVGVRHNTGEQLPGPDMITTGGNVQARVPSGGNRSLMPTGRAADASELFAAVPGGAVLRAPKAAGAVASGASALQKGFIPQISNIASNLASRFGLGGGAAKAVGNVTGAVVKGGAVTAPAVAGLNATVNTMQDQAQNIMGEINPQLTQDQLDTITPGYVQTIRAGVNNLVPGLGVSGANLDPDEVLAAARAQETRNAIPSTIGNAVGNAATGIGGQMVSNADRYDLAGSQVPMSGVQGARDVVGGSTQKAIEAGAGAVGPMLPQSMQDALARETSQEDAALMSRMGYGAGLDVMGTMTPEQRSILFSQHPALRDMTQGNYQRYLEGAASAGTMAADRGSITPQAGIDILGKEISNMSRPGGNSYVSGNITGQQMQANKNKMQGRLAGPDVIVGNTLSRNQRHHSKD